MKYSLLVIQKCVLLTLIKKTVGKVVRSFRSDDLCALDN